MEARQSVWPPVGRAQVRREMGPAPPGRRLANARVGVQLIGPPRGRTKSRESALMESI